MAAQLEAARLRAALAGKDDPLAAFKPPQDAPSDLIEMHRRFLVSQTAEQNAKIAAIDRQVAQKEAERATIKASIEKLKAILPPLQERVEIRKQLLNKELGSKLLYLTELQDLIFGNDSYESLSFFLNAGAPALSENRGANDRNAQRT